MPASSAVRRGSPSLSAGTVAARMTPPAIASSIRPTPAPIVSPATIAISAAIAPSVELIGPTIETIPTRSAR